MDVQTNAVELAKYTIDNALKEKIVPKRDRWAFGNRLMDTALDISTSIDMANSLHLDVPKEAEDRLDCQHHALALTFSLMTLVHVLRDSTHFDASVHEHWTGLVKKEQELLRGWIDSDRRKKHGS